MAKNNKKLAQAIERAVGALRKGDKLIVRAKDGKEARLSVLEVTGRDVICEKGRVYSFNHPDIIRGEEEIKVAEVAEEEKE